MNLCFSTLREAYRRDDKSVRDVFRAILALLEKDSTQSVWIYRAPSNEILASVEKQFARRRSGERLPLFGLPFAVKQYRRRGDADHGRLRRIRVSSREIGDDRRSASSTRGRLPW
jgi:hypothetical protein